MTRETRLKLALELTRLVMDLKEDGTGRVNWDSDAVLDVFETCYQRMEEWDNDAVSMPIVPAD
jgi:hypothetical protein